VALEDLPLEAVQYACVEVLKTETFMPPPATLRSHAREWTRLHTKETPAMSTEQFLALREAQLPPEEIAGFIAAMWPDDRLKDPILPYSPEDH